MPVPPVVVAAGITAAAQGANTYATGKMNRATRKWNEKQYDKQRIDALADWEMVNQYNSPKAQMARYRDAGLNPNLIYGQSQEAAPVRSSDTPSWNPRAPTFEAAAEGAQSILSAYYDIQLKEATIDNLEKQGTVAVQEAALKAANTASVSQQTARSEFELSQAKQLSQISIQAAEANLKKTIADTQMTLDNNERQKLLTANTLQQGIESILKSRIERAKTQDERKNLEQQLENAKKDGELKQLDINLKRQGIQPSDNIFFRVATQYLDKLDSTKVQEWYKSNHRQNVLDNIERLKRKKPGHAPSR